MYCLYFSFVVAKHWRSREKKQLRMMSLHTYQKPTEAKMKGKRRVFTSRNQEYQEDLFVIRFICQNFAKSKHLVNTKLRKMHSSPFVHLKYEENHFLRLSKLNDKILGSREAETLKIESKIG